MIVALAVIFAFGVLLLLGASALLTPARQAALPSAVSSSAVSPPPAAPIKARHKGFFAGEEASNVVTLAEPVSDYAGLPARITIPYGAREIRFQGTMLGAEAARSVRIIALSAAVVETALALLLLAVVLVLWTRRRDLRSGLASRLAAAKGSDAEIPTVPGRS